MADLYVSLQSRLVYSERLRMIYRAMVELPQLLDSQGKTHPHHEIERKFLVTKMPRLWGVKKVSQERYFIQRGDLLEEGYKRKGSVFEYEQKITLSLKEKTR